MGNSIEAVVSEILKDYENIILEATKEAAHKGQEDIMKKAKKFLQEYYKAYTPERYKRQYALQHSIVPYWKNNSNGTIASFAIGVEYDPSALEGVYRSESKYHQSGNVWKIVPKEVKRDPALFSDDFGTPEPDWILDNYLKGEHGGVYNDRKGTGEKMTKFFDNELPDRIATYMRNAIFDAMERRM